MNDSFRKLCTVQLTPDLDPDISLNVSVPGIGVHPGYVYMIQAILYTTDDNQIKEDLTAVGTYEYIAIIQCQSHTVNDKFNVTQEKTLNCGFRRFLMNHESFPD